MLIGCGMRDRRAALPSATAGLRARPGASRRGESVRIDTIHDVHLRMVEVVHGRARMIIQTKAAPPMPGEAARLRGATEAYPPKTGIPRPINRPRALVRRRTRAFRMGERIGTRGGRRKPRSRS